MNSKSFNSILVDDLHKKKPKQEIIEKKGHQNKNWFAAFLALGWFMFAV